MPTLPPDEMLTYLRSHTYFASSGCWEWIRRVKTIAHVQTIWNGKPWLIHRISWTIHNGPIPPKLFVLHKCDNPLCWNPDHLFLGTNQDNMNDLKSKRMAGKPCVQRIPPMQI